MMRFDRFTERAQEAAQRAAEIIQRYGHNQIDTEHILMALIEQPGGVIPQILEKLNVSAEALTERLDAPHDLVARDEGQPVGREVAFDDVEVGAADAARRDAHGDLPGSCHGIGHVAQRERSRGRGGLTVEHHRSHERAGSLRLRSDSANPAIISVRSARLMKTPGGVPDLGMGIKNRISFRARCSQR